MAKQPKAVQTEESGQDGQIQSDEPTGSTAVHVVAQRANAMLAGEPDPWPNQADVDFRNECAKIALREIVAWQVANRKAGQEDVAASWAFRYAARMLAQSKKQPIFATSNVRGVAQDPEPILPPEIEANMRETVADEIPGGMVPIK